MLRELKADEGLDDNFTLYIKYWLPFGEIMTDMERAGIKIDIEFLNKIQRDAESEQKAHENYFYKWVQDLQPDVKEFNPSSCTQMQQLLFAPFNKHGDTPSKA